MYMYPLCACGSSRGRGEKAFTLHLQTAERSYEAGPCRRWQRRGLPGWLRVVTLLQRNKTQLQGTASDPSTRLQPSNQPPLHGGEGAAARYVSGTNKRQTRGEEATITWCQKARK